MTFLKRVERNGKQVLRKAAGVILRSEPIDALDFDRRNIRRILLVRQDSRLGNLILMTPLISGFRSAFAKASIDVLVSEGFQDTLEHNPEIDNIIVFRKAGARRKPWSYLWFVLHIRHTGYDLAVDVSDGRHESLNNSLLTVFSGARYRLGYDIGDSGRFLNLRVPCPPPDMHMTDAVTGLVKYIAPETPDFPMTVHIGEEDQEFASGWLLRHDISVLESFFIIHPGGKGRKRWDAANFAGLIERITKDIGVRIVCIAGPSDMGRLRQISDATEAPFEILTDVTVNRMAAVIERCDLFISGDTGPMHMASALGRPTVAIFLSSDYRVYGPRGENTRIVISGDGAVSIDDVMLAIHDLMGGMELEPPDDDE